MYFENLLLAQAEVEKKRIAVVIVVDFHLTMYNQIFYHKKKIPTSAMKEYLKFVKRSLWIAFVTQQRVHLSFRSIW